MVHVSETCEPTAPHLLTHVHTTPATVHEVQCTTPMQQALIEKDIPPREHLVDAAYISSELLVSSREEQDIILRGPTRPSQGWHTQVEGAYGPEPCVVDWDQHQVRCPQGHRSTAWWEHGGGQGSRPIIGQCATQTCAPCPVRAACTRAKHRGRRLGLPPRAEAEAVADARAWYASAEGKAQYGQRAGIAGTLSQGVRAFGLRRTRYGGVAKTHVQHVAIAAAINVDRIVAWLDERPRATTRIARFAALAPASVGHPGEAAA